MPLNAITSCVARAVHGFPECFPLQFLQSEMQTERWRIYVASISEIVPDWHLSMTEAASLAPLHWSLSWGWHQCSLYHVTEDALPNLSRITDF